MSHDYSHNRQQAVLALLAVPILLALKLRLGGGFSWAKHMMTRRKTLEILELPSSSEFCNIVVTKLPREVWKAQVVSVSGDDFSVLYTGERSMWGWLETAEILGPGNTRGKFTFSNGEITQAEPPFTLKALSEHEKEELMRFMVLLRKRVPIPTPTF